MKLTPSQKKVLATLHDSKLTEEDRKHLKIQPKMLDKLVEFGLVRWAPTAGEDRKGRWILTPQGRSEARALEPA